MKLFSSTILFLLINVTLKSQDMTDKYLQYAIVQQDTAYVITNKNEAPVMIITQTTGDIISYKNEPVYPLYEVKIEPINKLFQVEFHKTIIRASIKFKSQLLPGRYTFSIYELLITKDGEVGHYIINLPQEKPFYSSRKSETVEPEKTKLGLWLYEKIVAFIQDNKKWEPAVRNGEKINTYFDEPFEFSLNIK